ncbi:MAG: type II toxin-antitoxin system VapB family antitoxin, partial [Thermodesulfobacteriota bacterium]
ITIENPRTEQLARQVAEQTGENLTSAITIALEERLLRLRGEKTAPDVFEKIMNISKRCAALPRLDPRLPDDIIGYDSNGGLE